MKKALRFIVYSVLFAVAMGCCVTHSIVYKPRAKALQEHIVRLSYPKGEENNYLIATGFAVDKDRIITAGHFCQKVVEELLKEKSDKDAKIKMYFVKDEEIFYKEGLQLLALAVDTDLCLLYLEDHEMPVLNMISSHEDLQIGDSVLTIGAPGGYFPVEAKGKVVDTDGLAYNSNYENIYITSIPVYPGNSGGPVIYKGKVAGLVVMGTRPYFHVSFIVKVDAIKEILKH